ncbi:cell division protein FtsL [Clostridium sp. BJN0001]|uniref:cell division protein FtsL n=1 Tax=Clostridium sp. BJN0001 TaxID=2930219 RepID=UPI001FD2E17C|nr:cell division protein FtsL [Clostridium sp. BJN0001]
MANNEYYYTKGNTAVNPHRKNNTPERDKKYEQLKKARKDRNKRLKDRKKYDRKYILKVAVIICVFGLFSVYRDGKAYTLQSESNKMDSEISSINEQNEALKIKLLKYSSLSNVQKNANSKLNMVVPTQKDTIKIDFSENYFEGLDNLEEDTSEKKNIFKRISELLKK